MLRTTALTPGSSAPAARSVVAVRFAFAMALSLVVAAGAVPPAMANGATCTDPGQGEVLYGGGTGEAGDPYRIATLAHLEALRDRVNDDAENQTGCAFLQTADIDLASIASWVPIGTSTGGSSTQFRGGYDGGFHRIANLTITDASKAASDQHFGLFGRVDRSTDAAAGSTYLRNLRLVGVDISLTWTTLKKDLYVGGLAGRIRDDVAVSQVSVRGSLEVDYRSDEDLYLGGIVGRSTSDSSVSDRVVFIGAIDATFGSTNGSKEANVGGLVGRTTGNSTLSLGYADADVAVTVAAVGGTPNAADIYAGVLLGTSSTNPSALAEMYAVGSVGIVGIGGSLGSGTGYAGAVGFIGNVADTFTDIYYIDSIADFAGGVESGFDTDGLVNVTSRTDAQMRLAAPATTMTGTGGRWVYANVPGAPNADGTWYLVLDPADGEYPYPVFFWEAAAAGAGLEEPAVVPAGVTLACTPLNPPVDATVTCEVTAGDAGAEILWSAAAGGDVFASTGVTLGDDGRGTFAFSVPRSALGRPLTVELVEWTAPLAIGTAGGPTPSSVPAGEGPAVPAWLFGLFGLLAAAGAVLAGRHLRPVITG